MRKHALVFTQESMVRPEFARSADVNFIVDRWEKSGVLEHTSRYQGQYGNFVGPVSYHEAVNAVLEADGMFMTLPSSIRDRYGNSVAEFLKAVDDGDEFLVEAGILKREDNSSKRAVRSRSAKATPDVSEASEGDAASDDNNNTE